MFEELEKINSRPKTFQFYTAEDLWTDEHTSRQMLKFHLDESVDLSSRNKKFIQRSVGWIVSHFGVKEGTRIIDFGCGPGLYTTRLAERKADVTGIDFSERSIRYARESAAQKGLNIEYIHQDYLEFDTEKRFELVMMIMCDFCALSPAQREVMLGKFLKILERGGSVLLDVYSLNAFEQREEAATYQHNLLDGFWFPEEYYGFLSTFKYEKEKVVLDKYTIIQKSRRRTIYNWLQYFSQESLGAEFERSGFRIEGYYSDVAGATFDPESAEFAIIAKKP
jgi:cyclopropane fatty-acyl-phospholipid synthase-like methyltransferase